MSIHDESKAIVLSLLSGNSIDPYHSAPIVAHPDITESLIALLGVSHEDIPAPSSGPNDTEHSRQLRRIYTEFLNIRFEYRRIYPLDAVLVAWQGHRLICFDTNLAPEYEAHLCLHIIGHLALGHINKDAFTIWFESHKIPFHPPKEEAAAKNWAERTASGRRAKVVDEREEGQYREIRKALRELGLKRGWARPLLHYISATMQEHFGPVRHIRQAERVDTWVCKFKDIIDM